MTDPAPRPSVEEHKRQRRMLSLLRYMIKYQANSGWPPTIRELSEAGYGSVSNVAHWIRVLEKDGHVERKAPASPLLRITDKGREWVAEDDAATEARRRTRTPRREGEPQEDDHGNGGSGQHNPDRTDGVHAVSP